MTAIKYSDLQSGGLKSGTEKSVDESYR